MNNKKDRTIKWVIPFVLIILNGSLGNILMLEQALRYTMGTSPALKASELEIKSKQATVKQASLLPNPEIEIELEDFGRAEAAAVLSQELELGGKRSNRAALAKTDQDIAEYQLREHQLELMTETAVRYIKLWEIQEKNRYLKKSALLADSILTLIGRRVRAGASPEVEKIRAEVELSNTRLSVNRSEKSLAAAKLNLISLWGKNTPAFDEVNPALIVKIEPLDTSLIFQNLQNSPVMQLQQVQINKQDRQMKLAQAERFTDMEVSAGVKYEGESKETMAILGFSIGLPLFNRNQGGIKEAKLGQKISVQEKNSVENRLNSELRAMIYEYSTHKYEAEIIKNNTLPSMEKAFVGVRKLYLHGKTGYMDLLDIQRSLLELEIEHIECLARLKTTKIRIESLSGTAFEDIIKGEM